MLVLARKIGERICIGDEIEIVVLRFHGNRVQLGIDAPQCIKIRRQELHQRLAGLAQSPETDAHYERVESP